MTTKEVRQRLGFRFGDEALAALNALNPGELEDILGSFGRRLEERNPETGMKPTLCDVERETYDKIVSSVKANWIRKMPDGVLNALFVIMAAQITVSDEEEKEQKELEMRLEICKGVFLTKEEVLPSEGNEG